MQAIKLLQLSSLDLAAYVEGELERNPLLESGSDEEAGSPSGPEAMASDADGGGDGFDAGDGADSGGASAEWNGEEFAESRSAMEAAMGTELENVFPDDGAVKTAAAETPSPAYSEWSGAG